MGRSVFLNYLNEIRAINSVADEITGIGLFNNNELFAVTNDLICSLHLCKNSYQHTEHVRALDLFVVE